MFSCPKCWERCCNCPVDPPAPIQYREGDFCRLLTPTQRKQKLQEITRYLIQAFEQNCVDVQPFFNKGEANAR